MRKINFNYFSGIIKMNLQVNITTNSGNIYSLGCSTLPRGFCVEWSRAKASVTRKSEDNSE